MSPTVIPRATPRDSRARGRKYHELLYYLRGGGGNAHWELAWLRRLQPRMRSPPKRRRRHPTPPQSSGRSCHSPPHAAYA
eukprot:scaffold9151_cov111-Isochrysis_galbana.AAC.4